MEAKTWSDFPVAFPLHNSGFDDDCLPLTEVTHVSHVKDAIRVIEDQRIHSSLVYDDSCLKTKRTQVSWVSPKTWANGYLYGNVAFAFDWAKLVKGKKVYWVEYRRTAKQDICRFLICKNDFTDHALARYDCTKPRGPLFFDADSKKWYHNNRVTSEYMVLADLSLSDCKRIRFVDHHGTYCNKSGSDCFDCGCKSGNAGARVISRLLGTGQTYASELFESDNGVGEIDWSVQMAVRHMRQGIVDKFDPKHTARLPIAQHAEIMKAAIMAFGCGQESRVKTLLSLYPNKASVETAFYRCMDEFFTGLEVSRD